VAKPHGEIVGATLGAQVEVMFLDAQDIATAGAEGRDFGNDFVTSALRTA
jgi:hypothetical protein